MKKILIAVLLVLVSFPAHAGLKAVVGSSSGGGSGTVNTGTSGYATYYGATGTAVSGTNQITIGTSLVTIGTAQFSNTVGIGTSTVGANSVLGVNGGLVVGSYAGNATAGQSNGIITSGVVMIGTSTNSYAGSNAQETVYFPGGGTLYGLTMAPAANTTNMIVFLNAAGSQVGTISQTSTGVAYNMISDRRIKENISPTIYGLNVLKNIKVSDFNFIADKEKKRQQGFIAQDLYAFYPEAVTTNGDDGLTELKDGKSAWQVDYGRLTPLIVRSIQQQQNEIESIKSTIASHKCFFGLLICPDQ